MCSDDVFSVVYSPSHIEPTTSYAFQTQENLSFQHVSFYETLTVCESTTNVSNWYDEALKLAVQHLRMLDTLPVFTGVTLNVSMFSCKTSILYRN